MFFKTFISTIWRCLFADSMIILGSKYIINKWRVWRGDENNLLSYGYSVARQRIICVSALGCVCLALWGAGSFDQSIFRKLEIVKTSVALGWWKDGVLNCHVFLCVHPSTKMYRIIWPYKPDEWIEWEDLYFRMFSISC